MYPQIDNLKCINCNLCKKLCPSNDIENGKNTVIDVYASWTYNKAERKKSTSGGIFSELARQVLKQNGVVAGVQWSKEFTPEHVLITKEDDIDKLKGSKYAQSNTGNIYQIVQDNLLNGKMVLFSGTPCQNAALKAFLKRDYHNLICVDFVCHGVPSAKMLREYYKYLHRSAVKNVSLRLKDPYWDYTFVKIEYADGYVHKKLTIDDDYFNLFNIGYSLRPSCHYCKYTNVDRIGDITLADFWGYKPHDIYSLSYNKGTSCVLVNSEKGSQLLASVQDRIYIEKSDLQKAIAGNKCLQEPFQIDEKMLMDFWNDYENGKEFHELNEKYAAGIFKLPKLLFLRRMYKKYRWVIKR